MFFPGTPPVSTVVQVSAMMPSREVLIEVEATAYLPELDEPDALQLHGRDSRLTRFYLQDFHEEVRVPSGGFPFGFDAAF